MAATVGESLDHINDYIPEGLSHPDLNSALDRAVSLIGSAFASCYLEWHFTPPEQCDLLVSIPFDKRDSLRKHLLSDRRTATDRRWKILLHFLDTWDDINKKLQDRIPHIWLAFDFDPRKRSFIPPNLHFCLDPGFKDRSHFPDYRNTFTRSHFNRCVNTIVENCFPHIPTSHVKAVSDCCGALGTESEILHLSVMHCRVPPVFKLNCLVAAERLEHVLKRLHWPGNTGRISGLCAEFAPKEKRVKCNICFDPRPTGRFELELEYNSPLKSDERRKMMFASLCGYGLLSRRQKQQLSMWPGRSEITSSTRDRPLPFERWLDMKLCLDSSDTLCAKAYLGFAPYTPVKW